MRLPDGKDKKKFVILGVDVGTTNIRCIAYDQFANVLGKAQEKVILFFYTCLIYHTFLFYTFTAPLFLNCCYFT